MSLIRGSLLPYEEFHLVNIIMLPAHDGNLSKLEAYLKSSNKTLLDLLLDLKPQEIFLKRL
jgi:hypothetical protein